MCEKDISNPAPCSCKNDKYLARTVDDSVITYDEIIVTKKIVPTKSTSTNLYVLITFLLITIALLIAFSIYC